MSAMTAFSRVYWRRDTPCADACRVYRRGMRSPLLGQYSLYEPQIPPMTSADRIG